METKNDNENKEQGEENQQLESASAFYRPDDITQEYLMNDEDTKAIEKFRIDYGRITEEEDSYIEQTKGTIHYGKLDGNIDVVLKLIKFRGSKNQRINHLNKIKSRNVMAMTKMTGHKNIVKFHGWFDELNKEGEYDGIRLITEKLNGKQIQKYMKEGYLNDKQKIKIMLDCAEAIEELHSKNIIHRGIRASNIMAVNEITSDTPVEDIVTKIYHFGVAKEGDNAPSATHVPGTIKYSAPELIGGETYDEKVDLWSFAIYAFGLLAEQEAYSDKKLRYLNDTRIKMNIDKNQLRPDKYVQPPYNCREDFKNLYKQNWDIDPKKRMTSKELVQYLKNLSPK